MCVRFICEQVHGVILLQVCGFCGSSDLLLDARERVIVLTAPRVVNANYGHCFLGALSSVVTG